MLLLNALLLFGGCWLIGWWLCGLMGIKNLAERVGLSWLFGSSWLTVVLVGLTVVAGISFSATLVRAVLIGSIVVVGVLHYVIKRTFLQPMELPRLFFQIKKHSLLLLILSLPILLSFIPNLIWPVTDWDALALYDFRAKVLVAEGTWRSGLELGYFFQYPPYTSYLHAMSYILGFEQAKIWYSLLYFSFILTFYSLLRRVTKRSLSLMGAILTAYTPLILEHSTVAYTNLAYSLFLSLGIIYLWLAGKTATGKREWLHGILCILLSMWVRLNEPFWAVGLILVLVAGIRFKQWFITFAGAGCLIWGKRLWPWLTHYLSRDLVPTLPSESPVVAPIMSPIERIGNLLQQFIPLQYVSILLQPVSVQVIHLQKVCSYLLSYVWPLFNYLLIPWVFVASQDFKRKEWYRLAVINGTLLLILLVIFAGTYIFSFIFETWDQIGGSATRMSMFLVPLILYYIFSSPVWPELFEKYVKNNRD